MYKIQDSTPICNFPDQGDAPEYNAVDASLWYVIAVYDFLQASKSKTGIIDSNQKKSLQEAVEAILTGYSQGTRYGIRMDQDGLLAAGVIADITRLYAFDRGDIPAMRRAVDAKFLSDSWRGYFRDRIEKITRAQKAM